MQTVNETIAQVTADIEISRLRLAVGSLRDEAWRLLWDGLDINKQDYDAETDQLLYGGSE